VRDRDQLTNFIENKVFGEEGLNLWCSHHPDAVALKP